MKIDLKNAALIVLDYQNDVVHEKGAYAAWGIPSHAAEQKAIANTKKLLEAFRKAQARVIFVRIEYAKDYTELRNAVAPIYVKTKTGKPGHVKGSWGAQFLDELTPRENETVIPKSRINPFSNKKFGEVIKGYQTLILAGVATNFAVEATARTAADMDYEVIIAEDCCASMNKAFHDFAIKNILPHMGAVLNSKEIIKAIA